MEPESAPVVTSPIRFAAASSPLSALVAARAVSVSFPLESAHRKCSCDRLSAGAGIPYGPTYEDFLEQIQGFYDAQAAAYLQPGSAGWYAAQRASRVLPTLLHTADAHVHLQRRCVMRPTIAVSNRHGLSRKCPSWCVPPARMALATRNAPSGSERKWR